MMVSEVKFMRVYFESSSQDRSRDVSVPWTVAVTVLALLAGLTCRADEVITPPSISTLRIIRSAAHRYGVDSDDLVKIAYLESTFREDARRVNPNGSVDVGMFQVNSVHWDKACKRFDVFSLQGNALCAAKLLRIAKKHETHDAAWVGRYHSKTPSLKSAYADRVANLTIEEE